jgi:hypothetical protein
VTGYDVSCAPLRDCELAAAHLLYDGLPQGSASACAARVREEATQDRGEPLRLLHMGQVAAALHDLQSALMKTRNRIPGLADWEHLVGDPPDDKANNCATWSLRRCCNRTSRYLWPSLLLSAPLIERESVHSCSQ